MYIIIDTKKNKKKSYQRSETLTPNQTNLQSHIIWCMLSTPPNIKVEGKFQGDA